jgi:transposase
MTPQQRLAVRKERSRRLETWLRTQRGKLSRKSETAKAIDYSLKRWPALTRFLADGRLCISNERCAVAVGRHN